jgi:acetyl-CoA carboxylase biotin carboxyl carrier protein
LLTFEQMKELIELVASHRLGGVEVERSGFRFKVDGEKAPAAGGPAAAGAAGAALAGAASPAALASGAATAAGAGGEEPLTVLPAGSAAPPQGLPVHAGELVAAAGPAAAPAAAAPAAAAAKDLHVLNSPIVGTFYAAPAPDAPPFVNVGDRVHAGQVMCIIEAMKLMNEIESDVHGTVAKVFPQNAQAVEYGEPLFAIRTA